MRRLIVLLIVLMPSVSWAMEKFVDFVQDNRGNIITGVSVTVYTHGTTNKATIYSDNGLTLKSNPFNNATDGTVQFYAANGRYDLVYSKVGVSFTSSNTTDRVLFDSVDFAGGGGSGSMGIGNTVTSGTPASLLYVGTGPALAQASLTGLILGNGASAPTAYTGTTCTNQVIRVLSFNGTATCVTLTSAYVDSTILTTAATVTFGQGGTGLSTALDDTVMVSSGTAWVAKVLPNCIDSGGNHLNYTASTNSWSCGTTGGMAIGNAISSGTPQKILYVDVSGNLAQLSCSDGLVFTYSSTLLTCGSIDAATRALDNLSSVAIATALIPASAAGVDFGSATKPWKDFYLAGTSGTPGTNNFKLTGAATAARTITLPDASLTVAGINVSNSWSAGVKQTFAPNATNSGLNIGSVSGDPASPANGDIWYDSTGNKFRCRENGASANCIGAGGTFLQLNGSTLISSLDPVSNSFVSDEFCGGNPNALYGDLRWTPSGAAGVATVVVAGHPCILQTQSTNSSHTGLFGGVGTTAQVSSAETFDTTWIVRPNVNGGTLALSNWRLGYADAAGAPPSNGFYLEKLNGDTNWFCVVMNATTPSRTDTTVAVVSNTWYRIRIRRIDASHIGCTVNAAAEVSNAGTEPSFSMVPFTDNTSGEAFSHFLDHDYFHQVITGLTR